VLQYSPIIFIPKSISQIYPRFINLHLDSKLKIIIIIFISLSLSSYLLFQILIASRKLYLLIQFIFIDIKLIIICLTLFQIFFLCLILFHMNYFKFRILSVVLFLIYLEYGALVLMDAEQEIMNLVESVIIMNFYLVNI
jgi:hypothetical protein